MYNIGGLHRSEVPAASETPPRCEYSPISTWSVENGRTYQTYQADRPRGESWISLWLSMILMGRWRMRVCHRVLTARFSVPLRRIAVYYRPLPAAPHDLTNLHTSGSALEWTVGPLGLHVVLHLAFRGAVSNQANRLWRFLLCKYPQSCALS